MLDVRALGNFILDQADRDGIAITNMALNKIAYFVHCDYLLENRQPLVRAKIEAWQHGPVFREIYHEFKVWDDRPIRSRAKKVDPVSGDVMVASMTFGVGERQYIAELVRRYMGFSAAQLRAISHRDGGPWHAVWGHDGKSNPGMRITDDLILERYSSGALQ
jgi:uncharacterized phage-associated protein